MLKKSVAYMRYSSDQQTENSIEAQQYAIDKYAETHGYIIGEYYVDRAKSGTDSLKRIKFQRMLEDAKQGKFDYIIVHKSDRFSREGYKALEYEHILLEYGVRLIRVDGNNGDSPDDEFMKYIDAGLNRRYSRALAKETMKGMASKARKALHVGGKPPLGFAVTADMTYEVVESEAEIVRLVFAMYSSGKSYNQIIGECQKHGYKTRSGQNFGKNSFNNLLSNEKYNGIYTFNKRASKDHKGRFNSHKLKNDDEVIRIKDALPKIIDDITFERVQKRLSNNRTSGKYKAKTSYLLTGKIICGVCGYKYQGNSRSSKRGKNVYTSYRCGNREQTHTCDNTEIERTKLERFVIKELKKNLFNKKTLIKIVDELNKYRNKQNQSADNEVINLKKRLTEIDKEIGNIVNAITSGVNALSLKDKLFSLETEKKTVESDIDKLTERETESITADDICALLDEFDEFLLNANIQEQQEFINKYIYKITVQKEHVIILFRVPFLDDSDESHTVTAEYNKSEVKEKQPVKAV